MNVHQTIAAVLGFALFAANSFAENRQPSEAQERAQDAKEGASKKNIEQQPQRKAALRQALVYVPPMRGAPDTSRLIGGGTRALSKEYPRLAVLAPRHTGLTSRAQPVLYWHISEAVDAPLRFVLVSDQAVRPIVNTKLDAPKTSGIQKLRLWDYGVSFEVGAEYQWSIALVPHASMRSYDIVTSGKIKRVEEDAELQKRLTTSASNFHAQMFAQSGLWYDAIEAISKQIDADPADQIAREARARIFDQVGLTEVAEHERNFLRNPTAPTLASP